MPHPSKPFYAAFGEVVYHYASAEFGIKGGLGAILKVHTLDVLVLAEPYSALALRNVAKAIVKDSDLSQAHKDRFVWLIGQWGSFAPLRNAIAHNRWRKGKRRASMKPFSVDIRSGSSKLLGTQDTDRDWTAKELRLEAAKLYRLNFWLSQFLNQSGLFAIIEQKEAEARAAIAASSGSSTSDSASSG